MCAELTKEVEGTGFAAPLILLTTKCQYTFGDRLRVVLATGVQIGLA
jgi:hypothetical protein